MPRSVIEILSFKLEDLPETIKKLRKIEKGCRERKGELRIAKHGVDQMEFRCVFEEHPFEDVEIDEEPEGEGSEEGD